MPLFVCECCGTIENTALGFYWSRKRCKFKDKTKNGEKPYVQFVFQNFS